MDKLISGIPGVFAYLDDLIIVSKNIEDRSAPNSKRTETVLKN